MALICRVVTKWVKKQIEERVDKWVEEQRKECQQYPWYDPRGWFCWLVTVTVMVASWITKEILVPISEKVCHVMTGAIFYGTSWLIAAIDSVTQWNLYAFAEKWLVTRRISFIKREPAPAKGVYIYYFICHCSPGKEISISVTASTDDEAADKAHELCVEKC